jgi:uncharacterized PurR-regulated membrane protein YhhQ (DUF165 family)
MTITRRRRIGIASAILYILTILAANWLIVHVGIITLPLTSLVAPAGVLAAGLAFGLRDITHDYLGHRAVLAAILAGAALSYLVSPTFAAASAVAFLVSELADFAVYTPLRQRYPYAGIAASNTIGATIDSRIFLTIAFGSLEYLPGQVVGKLVMIVPAWLLMALARASVLPRYAPA